MNVIKSPLLSTGHTKLSISGNNMCSGPLLVEDGSTWTPVCQSSFSLNNTTPDSMCRQMRCGSSGRLEPAQCNSSTPLTLTCSGETPPPHPHLLR